MEAGHPVLLYDSVCGLCNRLVQFTLRHDRRRIFRFAPLQGELAQRLLTSHGAAVSPLDSVYVVVATRDEEEALLARSAAVIYLLRVLNGRWRVLAGVYGVLPRVARDMLYDFVARNRYRVFGKLKACPVPPPGLRERFLG